MASQKMGHVKSAKQVKRAQRTDLNVCHAELVSYVWKGLLMIHPYHGIRIVFTENENVLPILPIFSIFLKTEKSLWK